MNDELPEPSPEVSPSQVTLKTVFTICLGVLIVLAVAMAILKTLVTVSLACAALVLAVTLDHGVRLLVGNGLRRSLAIVVVILFFIGLLVGLGFTLIPPAITQGKALVGQAPSLARSVSQTELFQRLDHHFQLGQRIAGLEHNLPTLLDRAASPILAAVGSIFSLLIAFVTVFLLVAFMLVSGGRVIQATLREARPETRQGYAHMLQKIDRSIGGYIGGLSLICALNATCTTIFLAINRVPAFLPLGILSGFSSTVPYAGPLATGAFITLITLATQGPWHALASLIYFVAYGQVEGNVLSPLVFRRTTHVNPVIVLLSVLFFGELGGIIGAILAVPAVATLQILVREVLRARRENLRLQRERGETKASLVPPEPDESPPDGDPQT
jgi:predicted PurR-regulated permease PerM